MAGFEEFVEEKCQFVESYDQKLLLSLLWKVSIADLSIKQ